MPPPRDAGLRADEPLPASAAFDEADVSDKPLWVQALPRLTPAAEAAITKDYDATLETLDAVNDGVTRMMKALEETHQLADTIVMFTSDNGFLFGEHRIPSGKGRFYEPGIRVPLVMRGPGIERGITQCLLVANVDLAADDPRARGSQVAAPGGRHVDGPAPPPQGRGCEVPCGLAEFNSVFELDDRCVDTSVRVISCSTRGRRSSTTCTRIPTSSTTSPAIPRTPPCEADLAARLAKLEHCSGPTCRSA